MNKYQHFLANEVAPLLEKITVEHPPLWGVMSAQHMVEHLNMVICISNGKIKATCSDTSEKLIPRQLFFTGDFPFKRSFRIDALPETPGPLRFENLTVACEKLLSNIAIFLQYVENHPDMKEIHPFFGPLNVENWLNFQARHIRYHLAQFAIVENELLP